jgi:hypothetical protein
MESEQLRRALEAMADHELRVQLADGNFDALGEIPLSDEERILLTAVAKNDPEVVAFDVGMTELFAYIGDMESYYQDQIADETPGTPLRRASEMRRFPRR